MTAPQFIAADSYCSEFGSTSGTVTIPASALPGDVVLLVINEAESGDGGIPAVTGLTFTPRLYRTATNYALQGLYWTRVLTAGDAGTVVTATWGANRSWSMSAVVYRGAATAGSPLGGIGVVKRGTGTAVTFNAVTATVADSLIVANVAALTALTAGFPTPSGYSERVDNSGTNQYRNHQVSDRAYGSAGAKTAGATTIASTTWMTQAVELLPSADIPGTPKVWNGLAWVPATPKVWNGSVWVAAAAKVWNGSVWVSA